MFFNGLVSHIEPSAVVDRKFRQNVPFVLHVKAVQLVVGFSRRENLATSGGGPGFSVGSIQPGKVQLSGGAEWLEARVGKRFPRNWGRRSLSNLSCRTFLSVAVVRRRS